MKKIIMLSKFQSCVSSLAIVVITSFAFSACSSVAKQIPLSDPPTALDQNFGSSVARMIELQRRPAGAGDSGAGYQLEGWEAEKILNSYGKSD